MSTAGTPCHPTVRWQALCLASTFEEAAQPRGPRKNTYITSDHGRITLTFQPKPLLISALAVDESEQGDV
jgi:hypothetical protein